MTRNWNELAASWIDYHMRLHPGTGDLRRASVDELEGKDEASQQLIELLINDREAAIEVVASILSQTSEPWILENVGAGPLESLLRQGDPQTVRAIEQLVQRYPNAIEALRSVWTRSLPPNAKESLQRMLSAQ
jgi:hypothetical protein